VQPDKVLAIVLAGGRGERLGELTRWHAKPAIPIGGSYRIIDFPLSNCVNSGIRRIAIATQYKSHSLNQHIQHAWSFSSPRLNEFIELWPAQQRNQEGWYTGTANAVYQNLDLIEAQDSDLVLVLAGDHVYKMDYTPMLNAHLQSHAQVTVGCVQVPIEEAGRFGVMSVDNRNCVVGFAEKPDAPESLPGNSEQALASMGIYVFNKSFLLGILKEDAPKVLSSHDFGKDIIPAAVERQEAFAYALSRQDAGMETLDTHSKQASLFVGSEWASTPSPYWQDVGTLDAYWRTNMDLIEGHSSLSLYDASWPIHTRQSASPPTSFLRDEEGHAGFAMDSLIGAGCRVKGARVANSVLCDDVCIEENSTLEGCVVLPGVSVGSNCHLHRAVVDQDCVIPSGTTLGENLTEDAEHFFVSPQNVVLVTEKGLRSAREAAIGNGASEVA